MIRWANDNALTLLAISALVAHLINPPSVPTVVFVIWLLLILARRGELATHTGIRTAEPPPQHPTADTPHPGGIWNE